MSCCGQKRDAWRKAPSTAEKNLPRQPVIFNVGRPRYLFRYEGSVARAFKGVVTGKTYLFSFKGETRLVDDRDADAFMAEPLLKQIILHG